MPIDSVIRDFAKDAQEWRRDIHAHPELLYDVPRTANFVADRLRGFGCDDVKLLVGGSGVVGVIKGAKQDDGRVVGLRADMDALPIQEETNLPYRSRNEGKMHACGHDGHTAMLLGAARYLAQTRDFAGTAVVIFQPAEEGGAGARAMLNDGLMERFGIQEVFGMHNMPTLPVGAFALRKGPLMAAADKFTIRIEGKGGHAASPHTCQDPLLAGANIVMALQSIVSRNVDPLDSCVVSATRFDAGTAFNIIPQTAEILGTVRTLTEATRDLAERRVREIVAGVASAHGVSAALDFARNYPSTRNHPEQTDIAAAAARRATAAAKVMTDVPPVMGAEDFSFMLEARPGAFIFIGNGDTAGLHHPGYDFNDAAIPYGMTYWAELVENGAPA
jgi:hippurate hydrolase